MESLSGLTDFVVSITNVKGGLKISEPFGDCSHSWHLHATHLKHSEVIEIYAQRKLGRKKNMFP